MKKQIRTIELGGETFSATWDMTAWANFEKLSGSNAFEGFTVSASNALDAMWSAIDAAAAAKDLVTPVTRRRLGTLVTSMEDMTRVLKEVSILIEGFMPEKSEGKGNPPAVVSPHHSGGATSSHEPTLELESAISGV